MVYHEISQKVRLSWERQIFLIIPICQYSLNSLKILLKFIFSRNTAWMYGQVNACKSDKEIIELV